MQGGGRRQQWDALASQGQAVAGSQWLAGRMDPPRVTLTDALSRINLSGHQALIQVRGGCRARVRARADRL